MDGHERLHASDRGHGRVQGVIDRLLAGDIDIGL
jgi:hypothetical protein